MALTFGFENSIDSLFSPIIGFLIYKGYISFRWPFNNQTHMRYLFAFICLAAITIACGGGDAGSDATSSSTSTTSTAAKSKKPDGKKIYKQYCVTCHGIYGDMGASGAHDLSKSELDVPARALVITNGRGAMTPFKSLLDEDEIEAVAKYTLELKQ